MRAASIRSQLRDFARSGWSRAAIYASFTALALAVNALAGREMAWDMLNYHVYAGFSALHDRFSQDYFAAGPQSYFNPYGYLPFYALLSTHWPAWCVASILAALHSAILWISFEFGARLAPTPVTRIRTGVLAAIFAALNPVLLQQIGTSFNDILTAEFALAGWLALVVATIDARRRWPLAAGLLLGAACALKPTNAIHGIAAATMLFTSGRALKPKLRATAVFGGGGVAGFAALTGAWGVRLYHSFGNPFFPLLNGFFKSPEFITGRMIHYRFIPDSVLDGLWRPFALIDPSNMRDVELMAPDVRYAALVVALVVAVGARIVRLRGDADARPPAAAAEASVGVRSLIAVTFAFLVDWTLWLIGSGNGRYFLVGGCVGGILLVAWIEHLGAHRPRARTLALSSILAIQATQLALGTEYRWHAEPWRGSEPWFELTVPEALRRVPTLHLSIGGQTNSYVVPYLDRRSGLVNISGGYALDPDGANGARVDALIDRYWPSVRVLLRGERLHGDHERGAPSTAQSNAVLARFGLEVNGADCLPIVVHGLPPDFEATFGSHADPAPRLLDPQSSSLLSCGTLRNGAARLGVRAANHSRDIIFERLERQCPSIFQPKGLYTEYDGRSWIRRYMNTDVTAWVSAGSVKFQQSQRGADIVWLGSERRWLDGDAHLVCGRRDGNFFARVQESGGDPLP